MKVDYHVHTGFSYDSESTPEEMIQAAVQKGLRTICITDHQDTDFAEPGWEIDFEQYFPMLQKLKEQYSGKIEVLIGMEYGLQIHLGKQCEEFTKKYPFDFVIGSVHMFDGYDPYYPEYFNDKTDEQGYRRAFEITLENIRNTLDFDVLGHIDYIVRYGRNQAQDYFYVKYADYLDEILKCLIANGKGLELNTGGWKAGLSFAHPHQDILKRYKELGGEIITIGSDAHAPKELAYEFGRVKEYLQACGFKYYTEFRQRKPHFCAI